MRENLTEKNREDAMRIFEALSHVDEELLARCEEPVEKNFVRKRSIWYYGSAVAACLCLFICGAALVNGRVFLNKSSGADGAVSLDSVKEEMAVDAGGAEPREEAQSAAYVSDAVGTQGDMQEAAAGENEAMVTESGIAASDGTAKNSQESQKENTDGEKITLQEARSVAVFGEYVPDCLPSGYVLESVYREKNGETGDTESIRLCWTHGMDSIFWTISMADAASNSVVDISRPETYDVHLYEIPYADTVPQEYRQVFDNPVFAEADFSLELVKSRMKVISDVGDTDTPRGDFSVLYENGVLVRFNGRGDAESIYQMFP